MILSNKIELNMKIAAIDQIIYIIGLNKNKNIILNELLNFAIQEINNVFQSIESDMITSPNNIKTEIINYITSLLKTINLIIFYYPNDDIIKNILNISFLFNNDNEINTINLIHNIFSSLFLFNHKNKHLLLVYGFIFIHLSQWFDNVKFNLLPCLVKSKIS